MVTDLNFKFDSVVVLTALGATFCKYCALHSSKAGPTKSSIILFHVELAVFY